MINGRHIHRITEVAFWGLLAVYLLVFLWTYQSYLIFEAETDAYFRRAFAWLQGGALSFRGPPMGPFHLHHGPVFYIVSAALMWISPELEWLFVAWLCLSCFGAWLLFRACEKHVGKVAALIGIFGLLSSSFAFEYSRQLWHSSLLPAVAGGILFSIERGLSTRRLHYFLVSAGLCGLAIQLHIHSIGYAALVLFVLIRERKNLGFRGIAACFCTFLLISAPILVAVGSVFTANGGAQITGWLSQARGELLAKPVDVVTYFLGHMGTAWGQTFSPWLSGIWVLLLCIGSYAALRQRNAFGIVLLVNLLLGLVVQSVLWGYMWAPWYLHVNMYAAFALCAYGAHGVNQWLSRLPAGRYVASTMMLITAVGVIADATVSPPAVKLSARPTLSAPEVLALSRKVAPRAPCASDVNSRVHGLYFSSAEQLMGIGYLHLVAARHATQCRPDGDDLLVTLPADRLKPLAVNVPSQQHINAHGRNITIHEYQSGVDRSSINVTGPYAALLMAHWRDLEFHPPREPTTHVIHLQVVTNGMLNVLLRGPETTGECPVEVVNTQGAVATKIEVDNGRSGRHLSANIAEPGNIQITIGPCLYVPLVDVF